MDTQHTRAFPAPFGLFTATITDTRDGPALSRLDFGDTNAEPTAEVYAHAELADRVFDRLATYFKGEGLECNDIPLTYAAAPFTLAVWDRMRAIPFGRTMTYGQIADELGSPGGAIAVGNACRTNPIPIFIPCHRVLDSAGKLHGYAGGLERKAALLAAENLLITA